MHQHGEDEGLAAIQLIAFIKHLSYQEIHLQPLPRLLVQAIAPSPRFTSPDLPIKSPNGRRCLSCAVSLCHCYLNLELSTCRLAASALLPPVCASSYLFAVHVAISSPHFPLR
jgi:hypothetical protein